jgi:DNA-directed RNA polymerase I, II, and III subunit RPABC1
MELDDLTVIYRVRRTVLQMLKDRGYVVSEKKLNQSKPEFKDSYNGSRESLNMLVNKRRTESGGAAGEDATMAAEAEKIFVFFPDQEKFNVEGVSKIVLLMLKNNVNDAIVVIKGQTTVSRRVSNTTKILIRGGLKWAQSNSIKIFE